MEKQNKINQVNWELINLDHINGMTWRELQTKYNISHNTLQAAKKINLFQSVGLKIAKQRSKKQRLPMSEESKLKISKARKEFLRLNPDKHNWKSDNKFKSPPCEFLKNYLKERNIEFIEEYNPLSDRHYSVDIAFPDKKIGLEINGRQHYNADGSLKAYYQIRHDLIESNGWKLYEIPYNKVFNKEKNDMMIDEIFQSMDKLTFDYFNYKPHVKIKKIYYCIDCGKEKSCNKSKRCPLCYQFHNRKVTRPSKEELHQLVWSTPSTKISKNLGVSDSIICKWCKIYGISKPPRGYWQKLSSGKEVTREEFESS